METLLKKPEVKRDDMGRFEQHGLGLIKKVQGRGPIAINKPKGKPRGKPFQAGQAAGPGRPKGIPNKVSQTLKEMILGSLDRVGGEEYLAKLAIENSSAYAGLIGKVLPTTLATDESNGGVGVQLVFRREIVYPNGHVEIEGVTPKALPAPSHTLPSEEVIAMDTNDIKSLGDKTD